MPSKKSNSKTLIKRRQKRILGIFIDGINLDRATRRLQHKIAMAALVRSLSAGAELAVCRYYTVIPDEDDSRQLAFLDAVSRAGLTVVVKRLPPKGVARQVTTDLEMAVDMISFALGCEKSCDEFIYRPAGAPPLEKRGHILVPSRKLSTAKNTTALSQHKDTKPTPEETQLKRIIISVCPSQELSYPISLANEIGVDTVTADFSNPRTRNIMKSSSKWIDLSTSETIWRN